MINSVTDFVLDQKSNSKAAKAGTGIEGQDFNNKKIHFKKKDYVVRDLISKRYYMAFSKSRRGERLNKFFSDGVLELERSGELDGVAGTIIFGN